MIKTILDLKANKVYPFTRIQTAAYTLLDSPIEFKKESHVYYCDKVVLPSVTSILKSEGCIDDTWFNDYVRDRGSNIHLACHLDDINDLDEDTVGKVERPYLDAYRKFKRESGFVVEESEVPKANIELMFAGTPDKIGHFPNGTLRRAGLELHDDGTYRLIPFTDRQDIGIWKIILAIYFWKKNNLRRKT